MDVAGSWKEILTVGIALLGAVLGIMNTWQAISSGRVRLRVRPAYAIGSNGQTLFSIEIVNLSNFPVTASEVGFTMNGNSIHKPRAAVISPIILDGGSWPRRLEAREAVSVYFDPRYLAGSGRKIGRAYARTACGEVGYGMSEAAKQLQEIAA